MKKILPVIVASMLVLSGCSSNKTDTETESYDLSTPEGLYNSAFDNTFNSNYYYESKTENEESTTLNYAEYFLGDDLEYVSYSWYEYGEDFESLSIHYLENDQMTLLTCDNNSILSNSATVSGSVDEKSNLFKNENIEITASSITNDGVTLEFTVGSGDTYYVVEEISIEDNRIIQEVTTMYQDEEHTTEITVNTTRYYENTNDAGEELEKAKNAKDCAISEFADLKPEF